jgi:YidC/Oxa1 family membrane protein insertase
MPHLAAAITKAATTCSLPSNLRTSDHSIFGPIAKPIAEILAGFYSIVPNFGVAIILLSLAWMILIAPLTLKSTRSMLAMQKLQPQLKKLQAEHKNDRQAFAQAQMDLYKEHNVSPFGSCLPSILPLPVFFALFRVIDGLSHKVTYHGQVCAVPSFLSSHTQMYQAIVAAGGKINAFGLDLSKNALSGHATFIAALPFYVLLLIMIGTQYLQTAQMMNRNPAAADNPQMKFMKYLPIIFGVVCVRFPAGVILYYAVSNICRMAQQTAMYRYDPKVKALANKEVIEVEANTRRIDSGGTSVQTPAPRSRFRDLLAQAQDSARAEKDKSKGPASPGRPGPGGPTNKAGGKGQPPRATGGKSAPAASSPKANPNSGASLPKANPNARAKPAASSPKANPNAKPKPGASSPKANPNARPNSAASSRPPGQANPPPAGPAQAKPAVNGKATTPSAPSSSPSSVNGAGTSNGNGKAASSDPAPTESNGTNGNGSTAGSPPAKTGGRTGAQAPRTPRRRKGR